MHSSVNIRMQRLGELMDFFQQNHLGSYSLLTLNSIFLGFNVYEYLIELEQSNVLIRSKITINNKPVTHWQLKAGAVPVPSLNRSVQFQPSRSDSNQRGQFKPQPFQNTKYNYIRSNFTKRRNAPDNVHDFADDDIPWKKPKISSPDTDIRQISALTISVDNRNRESTNQASEMSMIAPRRLIEPPESLMRSLTIGDSRPSRLNPLSREFVPAPKSFSIFSLQSAVKETKPMNNTSTEKDECVVNNLSSEFITALTKNPVSVLYEFAQQRGMNCDIDLLEIAGPSHKPKISMVVTLNGRKFDTIVATSKKEGKRLAADAAVRTLISEGHFAERISRLSTRAAFKDDDINTDEIVAFKNSVSTLDKMASLVYNQLAKLLRDLNPEDGKTLAGRKVVSAIVMQDDKHDILSVVSLATGNRCISGDKISLQGKVINDCHAEIVVRRAFILFLYQQLDAQLSDSSVSLEIFEIHQPTSRPLSRCKVKSHITFHLYISTAPCGDSALFCNRENGHKKTESEMVLSKDHEPILENTVQGLLRSKIEGGEGTIPVNNSRQAYFTQTLDGIFRGERLKTMSCSDKICRWNYLGLQGALLTQIIEPIFLKSISLGNLYNSGHLSRALCCRLERDKWQRTFAHSTVNHPNLGYVHVGELQRETDKSNELSINWCYGQKLEIVDGVTGQLSGSHQQYSISSRISKLSLFHQYHKVVSKRGCFQRSDSETYQQAKSLSEEYERKKHKLFETFHELEYGSWIRKPSEQNQFHDTLYT